MTSGNKVLGIIFPNMHDEAVKELTELRTSASIPFGGRYRLIDFTLSEFVAAGVSNVCLVVKRNYVSLMDHLGSGREYDLARKNGGLRIFPPFAESGMRSYKGKIEALNNILTFIDENGRDTVILADSGIVSCIDYKDVLEKHYEKGAQITAIYKTEKITTCSEKDNVTFEIGDDDRITGVYINENRGVVANNAMWAYVIDKKLLVELVHECYKKGFINFENDVLQKYTENLKIYGYSYTGYLSRIQSLKCYFDANMDLLDKRVMDSLFSRHPVYTKIRDDAPARYLRGSSVKNDIVADGCCIEGYVEHSVLFRGVKIGTGAIVTNCVLMQDAVVEDGAILENVICDKKAVITKDKRLIGDANHPVFVGKKEIV